MNRRTTDLGTHGNMTLACSGRFVNATRHEQTGHRLAGSEVNSYCRTQRPATDSDLRGWDVQGLGEVVVGCVSCLIASRLAGLHATHTLSRVLGDQNVESKFSETRKLIG
jgi:hypothetical protein